jgi:hypothetical protein
VTNNWIKVYTSTEPYKIELLKVFLLKHNIRAISINKKDSSYLVFGDVELFVTSKDVLHAKNLINKQEDEPNA